MNNPAIRVRDWYEPIARQWLAAQFHNHGEVPLIVDGTKIGFGHQLLIVGLVYRKRAIPIAWTWVKHVKGHSRELHLVKTLTATMSIRPLTKTDEPFLWEMLYQAIYVPEGSKRPLRSIIYDEPELAKYVQGWGEPGDTGLVATNEAGQPIGAAWLRLLTGDNKGYGYIDDKTPELSIAVLPAYRGKGIGTSLLRRLLIEAQSHFASISLSVSPDNPALRLYRRLGFEVVGENDGSLTMKITLEDTLQNVEK